MNRRTLLARLPLLAALPWVASKAVAALPAAAPARHPVLGEIPQPPLVEKDYAAWWPPGEGWTVVEESIWPVDQPPMRELVFARGVNGRIESVRRKEPYSPGAYRRFGDRKPWVLR